MIDLYFWPTPNGYKPLIMLEEIGLDYTIKPTNILTGDQFKEDFLQIAPNNRIPAIVDGSFSLFESGAILIYLAEKTGKLLPLEPNRYQVVQWLMWQMGGLGPMMGQANHFIKYAKEDIPYGKKRYLNETYRLLGVLDKQLSDKDYIVGEYTIADIACYPWIVQAEGLGVNIETEYLNVSNWAKKISGRSAVKRSYEVGQSISSNTKIDNKAHDILFGTNLPEK
ncbi:MAG: glutathione S-transferase N-terminal domain-containing protein [Candidatus Caenarcaniphilales bacterium]|nr:glutathione S-transferase N-terminal domain-containing protein [Candidatus Caenarcaniphilales bacterium]